MKQIGTCKEINGIMMYCAGYEDGLVYKDEDAFLHHPDRVCYIPEWEFNNADKCAEGDEDSEVEYSSTEDDYENRYQGSREVGTEMEYQVIVELKEVEIEECRMEMEGNCELQQKLRDKYNMMSEYEGYAHIDDITEFAKEVLVDVLDDDGQDDYVCNDFEEEFHAALCDLIVGLGLKYHKKMKK